MFSLFVWGVLFVVDLLLALCVHLFLLADLFVLHVSCPFAIRVCV